MKVVLTGGTGFLGSWIARELVAAGHEVRTLVRGTSKLDALRGLPVETVAGDVTDRASMDEAMRGADAVIHCAGNTSARPRDRERVHQVNVVGTRTVMEAALAAGVGRAVHTSSIAAVGASPDPVLLNEDAPWNVGDTGYHYVDSKRAAELAALEAGRAGLDVVVLNPGLILGPGDLFLGSTRPVHEYMVGRMRLYPGGGLSFCDVRDVARAHVAALTLGSPGARYILAGQNRTFGELLAELHRLTDLGRARRLPRALGWTLGALSELVAKLREHPLEEVNRPVLRYGELFAWYDVTRAERALGYTPRPFEETLRDTVVDHLRTGRFPARTTRLEALLAGDPPSTDRSPQQRVPEPEVVGCPA
jgi:dihydroflavonol-4-reductase